MKAALPVALSALVGFCWKPLMAFSLAHFYFLPSSRSPLPLSWHTFYICLGVPPVANVQSPYKPGPEPCLLPCLCNTAEPEINCQFSERFSQLLPGPHILWLVTHFYSLSSFPLLISLPPLTPSLSLSSSHSAFCYVAPNYFLHSSVSLIFAPLPHFEAYYSILCPFI